MSNSMGKYIRRRRLALNLTQKYVSERLGFTTPQHLSNIETGRNALNPETARKLAVILDLKYETIVSLAARDFKRSYQKRLKNG